GANRQAEHVFFRQKTAYEIGCVSNILQMLKLPDGTVKVLVEGDARARIVEVMDDESHFSCVLEAIDTGDVDGAEVEGLRRAILGQFDQYVKLNKKVPPEILASLNGIDEIGR